MRLPSFLKRDPSATSPAIDTPEGVAQARARARRRLIGAVVLLGVGIVGFPLLFETQPRPIPVDIPIEIPKRDGAPPLVMPAPRADAKAASKPDVAKPLAPVVPAKAADAPREVAAPRDAAAETARNAPATAATGKAASVPAAVAAASKPAAKPAETRTAEAKTVEAKVAPKADDSARVKAILEGGSGAGTKDDGAVANGRFVVQVGAFADNNAARETRLKVEKLGLKTYTQVVDTDAGKRTRVRVGPFASRDDAAKAAERVKAAGLPAALLTL